MSGVVTDAESGGRFDIQRLLNFALLLYYILFIVGKGTDQNWRGYRV